MFALYKDHGAKWQHHDSKYDAQQYNEPGLGKYIVNMVLIDGISVEYKAEYRIAEGWSSDKCNY